MTAGEVLLQYRYSTATVPRGCKASASVGLCSKSGGVALSRRYVFPPPLFSLLLIF